MCHDMFKRGVRAAKQEPKGPKMFILRSVGHKLLRNIADVKWQTLLLIAQNIQKDPSNM